MGDMYAGAYWGKRRETVSQCAEQVRSCLLGLQSIDPRFSGWELMARHLKVEGTPPLEKESLERITELLRVGRNRRDVDGTVIDELGYSLNLWNGRKGNESAALNVTCGVYSDLVRNALVLDLPENLAGLQDRIQISSLLGAIAQAWEPDWAGVISRRSRNSRVYDPTRPLVDWIVYINRIDVDYSKLPASATALRVPSHGTLIAVQEQPIDASCPTDLDNVLKTEAAIFELLYHNNGGETRRGK